MYNYYRSKPTVTLEDGNFVAHFYTYRNGFPVGHHLVLGNRADAYGFALALRDAIHDLDAKLLSLQ